MRLDEDVQSKAIAAEWGIDPDLLQRAVWTLEYNNNDGFPVSHFVRFSTDTDPALLNRLGVLAGEFHRELSLNAFDGLELQDQVEEGVFTFADALQDAIEGIVDDFDVPLMGFNARGEDRAYHLDEERFTPSQFRKLSRARQIECMVQWFLENYEDPAVRLPYESREGGYQWIWGGPYDAREQISAQFADISNEDSIEAAVEEVTRDGLLDWAPKAGREHEYLNDDDAPDFEPPTDSLPGLVGPHRATAASAFLATEKSEAIVDENGNEISFSLMPSKRNAVYQQELASRIQRLEAALEKYASHLPPRNHNHPPELVEPDPIAPNDFKLVVEAVVEIKTDARDAKPDPEKLEAKASLFRRVAGAIGAWCGRKLDASVDSTIQWGVPIGLGWLATNPQDVQAALTAVAETASAWAKHLLAIM